MSYLLLEGTGKLLLEGTGGLLLEEGAAATTGSQPIAPPRVGGQWIHRLNLHPHKVEPGVTWTNARDADTIVED